MSDSKVSLALGQDIIDRWLDDGGIASKNAMSEAKAELTKWLAKADETEVQRNWLAHQNTFALWCLIEIELQQCPPKRLYNLVFLMRGEHELWIGRLLFALAIYLYVSNKTPQKQQSAKVVRLHAVIWSEIMLLHSVLSAYQYCPEPDKFMSVEFGLSDYQKLDSRLKSSSPSKLPGARRLLEELMGHGDPVAEFLLGLEEDYDSDLIRDSSDCGFVLASYYGALKADNAKTEDSSAWSRTFNKKEKEMLLRRITEESVGEYLGNHEATLAGFRMFGLAEHPASITEEDWLFFGGVIHHSGELLGNPLPSTPASDSWQESERKFDDHLKKHNDSSLYPLEFPSNSSLQFIKEQYDLVKRCKYRVQLAKPIADHRKEYLFNLVVESAKLFEAMLKACVICFNKPKADNKIDKRSVIAYLSVTGGQNRETVDARLAEKSKPTKTKDVPETIDWEGRKIRTRTNVNYARHDHRDSIANRETPKLNDYIFEVLHPLREHQQHAKLHAMDWGYGVLMTYREADGVLKSSCNVRQLLCAIALTAFVDSDHPFRSLWLPKNEHGLKLLIEEAYALYVFRNRSGGAHFAPNCLDPEDVLQMADKVFRFADKVIEEVLIDI